LLGVAKHVTAYAQSWETRTVMQDLQGNGCVQSLPTIRQLKENTFIK